MKNDNTIHKIMEKHRKKENMGEPLHNRRAVCDLRNPADAVLADEKGREFKLLSTDIRADYIGHYLRVAVRQRYRNDSEKTQRVRYLFPLSEEDSLLDFQAWVGERVSRHSEIKIMESCDGGPYAANLGYLAPGEEMSAVYVYARFTEADSDGRVTIRVRASERDPDPDSLETVGFFLRGNAAGATISSASTPLFLDRISRREAYVCPNDDTVLNAIMAKHAALNRESLERGEMDYEELLDLCPSKVNPVFDHDFVLTLEDFEVDEEELSLLPADLRGEVIDSALSSVDDRSREFLRAFFLNSPVSPILLPFVEAAPFAKKGPLKDKLFNMTEGEAGELLELFESTVENNLDAGGISGPLTLKDVLFILLPIVPPKFRIFLWNMSFDPMYMTHTETQLWALLFIRLIESEEKNEFLYKNLHRLSKDAVKLTPAKIKKKLMEKLSLSYDNGAAAIPGAAALRSLS